MKTSIVTLLTLVAVLLVASDSFAQKKGGGGKGGGGSDDGAATFYDLVRLPGWDGTRSKAAAVSEPSVDGSIYVVGDWITNSGQNRPCLWRINAAGAVAETIDLSPSLDYAADVNCLGMVPGHIQHGDWDIDARVAFADGSFIELEQDCIAVALTDPDENNIVRVVGNRFVDVGDHYLHSSARQWNIDVSGTPPQLDETIDLVDLAPENFSVVDCNNFGEIVGSSHKLEPDPSWHAIVASWNASGGIEFEFLPDFWPEAIDDAANIVGYIQVSNPGPQEGIVVAPDGTVTNLTLATGKEGTGANDVAIVNGVTQVVGATIYSSLWSGYLWTNGEMFNLNQLTKTGGGHLGPAEGINTSGVICGFGRFSDRGDDVGQGYLLIPKTR